ncbi:TIM barrel protein [Thermohalobacter berrensis]|uniref:Xylose isomerase-like TIM barrel domain-containing protein n=1 Tax=Thermohalobacter berrensis TaxID=99594 RepID=A0A419T5V8_9FIRM|nr:TIM barrel protein [Thermohalobacter berrensis]RKD32967.1 hypothetical protein BET03_10145 [Thermohalobacter berrensis]
MNLGFTFDENILSKIDCKTLFSKTKEMGISSIELAPDKSVLPIKTYKEIAMISESLNLDISFHVPYFAHNFLYEIGNFTEFKKDVLEKYEQFLSIVFDIQQIINKESIITIHGSKYENTENKNDKMYSTLSFLDWILNFIERKNLNLKFAIETVNQVENLFIGGKREDIYYILNKFKTEKLGICWDITHDSLNYHPEKPPLTRDFLDKVIHCHIHGVILDNYFRHISIQKSEIDFSEQVKFLKKNNFNGVLNLELLVSCCNNTYLDDLYSDIKYLKAF